MSQMARASKNCVTKNVSLNFRYLASSKPIQFFPMFDAGFCRMQLEHSGLAQLIYHYSKSILTGHGYIVYSHIFEGIMLYSVRQII